MKRKRKLKKWVKVTISLMIMLGFIGMTKLYIDFKIENKIANAEELAKSQSQTNKVIEVENNDNVLSEYECIGEFLLTGYDDCPLCQEEFVGTTALGVAPTVQHTVAVDPKVIPLGSHLLIDGIEYVAEDVGGAIKGYHIDIFVGSHEETFADFCNKTAEVYLIKWKRLYRRFYFVI